LQSDPIMASHGEKIWELKSAVTARKCFARWPTTVLWSEVAGFFEQLSCSADPRYNASVVSFLLTERKGLLSAEKSRKGHFAE